MTILQRYNGLDTIATFQLWQVFQSRLQEHAYAQKAYEQSKALQSPALYAMLRGILVDQDLIRPLREQFEAENKQLEATLDFITKSLGLGVINLASPTQVAWMFDCLSAKLPLDRKTGKAKTGREELEQLSKADIEMAPLCNIILAWRDRAKMLQVLEESLTDKDGRMRTFYKVAGTKTRRWSSSKNALWTGMNMQNIKRDEDEKVGHASIRSMFIADPRMKFLNIDLERADSWAVALEVFKHIGDRSYLDACSSSDLHTYVSSLVWPELGWTGDPRVDKGIASQFFYRQYDYRFMSKKGGHGSNYLGKARTLAIQMKIPVAVAERFQEAYFTAFPGIPRWHLNRARELQTTGSLTNLLGFRRNFHSRLDADATLREAIAYLGQSVTAGIINESITRIWKEQLTYGFPFEFLAQVHDSVLIQYRETDEEDVIKVITDCMTIPISVTSPKGEKATIAMPLEVSVGWNWASASPSNPDGLKKLRTGAKDDRVRVRQPIEKKPTFMDRRVSAIY